VARHYGPQCPHACDSVRAAKKAEAPDGLPVAPEAGKTAAGPAS
jgi:hypothetical protein